MNIQKDGSNTQTRDYSLCTAGQHDREASFSGSNVKTHSSESQAVMQESCSSSLASSSAICERPCVGFSQISHLEDLRKTIGEAFSDSDTSAAKSLIYKYGAQELSETTCPFSFSYKTYPNITPFALACRSGNLEIVKELYVDPKQLDQAFDCQNGTNGRTALMLAVMHGHKGVVKQLLEWGANPQIVDEDGHGVDIINFAFNSGTVLDSIEKLLKQHRKKNDLPQFEQKSGVAIFYREDTFGGNCRVQ
ncbi:ankyrin repeat domain-containing protein [Sansalvadorimonas verongulae]|uniref:ankyrin repeat domain-containing protein n=1 Tax=Sansalvadorimonas verongulae TaxID=2172824 RepID=UPI0018AD148A|nr:ankyrin repeat domain-containing protein [Sansalvadorimonas verongulae]